MISYGGSRQSRVCYLLMDANARTGRKLGERLQDIGIMGVCGRDELNDNSKLLLTFAIDNKVAIANTFSSTLKGRVPHTYGGVIGTRASEFKRTNYIFTRQAHRGRVPYVVVYPQPTLPAEADPGHNMIVANVYLKR